MEKSMGTRGQMSEAVSTGIFLTLSGGFQDAYTYYCRGNVFANAQTGNIVLMGSHLAAREWNLAVRYLAPVLANAQTKVKAVARYITDTNEVDGVAQFLKSWFSTSS